MSEWRVQYTPSPEQIAEELRAQRHHDVLCLVLKAMLTREVGTDGILTRKHVEQCVLAGQIAADLAYPPPKAEGT